MPTAPSGSLSSPSTSAFPPVLILGLICLYIMVGILAAFLLHPSAPSAWMALPLAVVAGIPQALASVRWTPDHPVPVQPKPPVERKLRLRGVGRKPPATIRQPSHTCEICNRPLTNPQSRLARVGSECIKTYGPRYKRVPNPALEEWSKGRAWAEVDLAARTVAARQKYNEAMQRHEVALAAWEQEFFGPEVQKTLRSQKRRSGHRAASAAGTVVAGIAYAVTALVL